jgi:hypothetical protein
VVEWGLLTLPAPGALAGTSPASSATASTPSVNARSGRRKLSRTMGSCKAGPRSPGWPAKRGLHHRRRSSLGWSDLDQVRRTLDRMKGMPDQARPTPDQMRRTPDQARRTLDQIRRTPDRLTSGRVRLTSAGVRLTSAGVRLTSAGVRLTPVGPRHGFRRGGPQDAVRHPAWPPCNGAPWSRRWARRRLPHPRAAT